MGDRSNYEYRFGPQKEWRIVIANTQPLREMAFKFAYDVYIGKGYDLRIGRESGLWCTIHSLHPDTTIFLAQKAGLPVGVVSVIPDSRLGLPADLIFPDQQAILRKAGRRLCEISSLVVAERAATSVLAVPLNLYKLAHFASVHLLNGTDVVATFMAHHASFYERFLLFDEISPEERLSPRTSRQVRYGRLNLETMQVRYNEKYGHMRGRRNLYRWFFGNEETEEILLWLSRDKRPMTGDELNYFGALKSRIFADAGSETVDILMDCYRQAEASNLQD